MPGVAIMASAAAFIKVWNYGMMVWLPLYVKDGLGRLSSDPIILSNLFDVGNVIGWIINGTIIDRIKFRNIILVPNILVSVPIFLSFRFISSELFDLYYILVPILGFSVGSVSSLLSSLIPQDLGRNPDLDEGAVATMTGIMDGTGMLGASVG